MFGVHWPPLMMTKLAVALRDLFDSVPSLLEVHRPKGAQMKLCKDRRFAALEDEDGKMVWRCQHRSAKFTPRPNLVTGAPVRPYQIRCSEARYFPANQVPYCGEEGRYWEMRQ